MLTSWQISFLTGCLLFLGVALLCIFVRVVKGPEITDRIMGINMMGTVVMCMLAIIAVIRQESYLIDICIIYAVISFLAVVVLAKVFMGVYRQQHEQNKTGGEKR